MVVICGGCCCILTSQTLARTFYRIWGLVHVVNDLNTVLFGHACWNHNLLKLVESLTLHSLGSVQSRYQLCLHSLKFSCFLFILIDKLPLLHSFEPVFILYLPGAWPPEHVNSGLHLIPLRENLVLSLILMHVLNHLFLKEPLPLILHQLLHTLHLLVLHQVHGETSILHRFPLTFLLLEIHLLFFSKSLTLVFFVHHPLQHMS